MSAKSPTTISGAEVGDTIVAYKFFYTPNSWEGGDNKLYILTQADYDAGEATVSRPFNDGTSKLLQTRQQKFCFTVDV